MKSTHYVPSQGDVLWLDFSSQAGHEQGGRRPAVVLSAKSYNKLIGLALVCPVTNRSKGYPFEVALPPGLPVQGVVLSDHIKSQDWRARNAEFIGKLDDDNWTMTHCLASSCARDLSWLPKANNRSKPKCERSLSAISVALLPDCFNGVKGM